MKEILTLMQPRVRTPATHSLARPLTSLFKTGFASLCLLALSACEADPDSRGVQARQAHSQSASLDRWLDERFDEQLRRAPMEQTRLGRLETAHRLGSASALHVDEGAAVKRTWLADLQRDFDPDLLTDQARLSYRLFEYDLEDALRTYEFIDHIYVFQHKDGAQITLPNFMINFHDITSLDDAENYLARLEGFDSYLGGLMARAEIQHQSGITLPAYIYPRIRESAQGIITGAPFDDGPDSPLFEDFKRKIQALNLPESAQTDLVNEARDILTGTVRPTYESLLVMLTRHQADANEEAGVWALPRGEAFYANRLAHFTTTDLSADEIHAIGLSEVERIQGEMNAVMARVGFKGSFVQFIEFLRADTKFAYENDDAGRDAYIADVREIIDRVKQDLDRMFRTIPDAPLTVRRVEPFKQNISLTAFHEDPSVDGTRPGTYYVNLEDMNNMPIYQMQAQVYHQSYPGHHMQSAIASELENLPAFRRYTDYPAFAEGWALYAEGLPKELGLYFDPYQEFGQLSFELGRAARLVVDTGIHAKQWSRDEAVTYMMENTANSEGHIRKDVDRFIVWPGQATSYTIGKRKIEELRRRAEAQLGDDFDLREFHDVVLGSGALPLHLLEDNVADWIADQT